MNNKKVLTPKEFVKEVCQKATDESIYQLIEKQKTETFVIWGNTESTWYDITKPYFEKYLKQFGRTNILL